MAKKKPAPKNHRFTATLEKMNAKMAIHYVEVPFDVEQAFGRLTGVRVVGTVNSVPVDRALIP